MRYSNAIRWYIKWWWAVGIAWFVSLLFLVFGGFGIIGKIINFLNVTISTEALKNIILAVYFPYYLFTLVFKGLDMGYIGLFPMFIFFLVPCGILAIIFKLILWGKDN